MHSFTGLLTVVGIYSCFSYSQVTVFGQSSGGTAIFALLASPLSTGLFHKAWLLSASPILNKTATDAFEDNEVFLMNTKCSDIECLYSLSSAEVTRAVPWETYPYWSMLDQADLPTYEYFDGAMAIVDGDLTIIFVFYSVYLPLIYELNVFL